MTPPFPDEENINMYVSQEYRFCNYN